MLFTESSDRPLGDGDLRSLVQQAEIADPTLAAAAAEFLSHLGDAGAAAGAGAGSKESGGADSDGPRLPAGAAPAVWLMQGESALVSAAGGGAAGETAGEAAGEAPEWVGSTDATTCAILAAWCPETGLVWCGHLDAAPAPAAAAAIETAICDLMAAPRVYLVGGYEDSPRRLGPRLSLQLLQWLHALPASLRLALCIVGAANTDARGAPRARQLAVRAGDGAARPYVFGADRGPEPARRFAAQHMRASPASLIDVWDTRAACYKLPAFDPILSSWNTYFMERLSRMEDAQLLANFSTSPLHESGWFCDDMRAMAGFLVAAQEPESAERAAAEAEARYAWCYGSSAAGGGGALAVAAAECGAAEGGAASEDGWELVGGRWERVAAPGAGAAGGGAAAAVAAAGEAAAAGAEAARLPAVA